jgi:hypothetical protein
LLWKINWKSTLGLNKTSSFFLQESEKKSEKKMTIQNKLIVIVITLAVGVALYLRFKDGIAPFLNDAGKNIGGSFKGGLDAFYKSIGLGEQTVTTQHGTITGDGAHDPLGIIPDAGKEGSGLVIGSADPNFLNETPLPDTGIKSYSQDSSGRTVITYKDGTTKVIDQNAPNDSKRDIFGNVIPASNDAFADSGNTPTFDSKGVPTGLTKGSVYVSGFGYMSQKQYEEYLAKQTQGAIFVDSASLDIHNQANATITPISTNISSSLITNTNIPNPKSKSKPTEPTSFTIDGGKFTNSLGFVGGKTTMGDNVVDTLSEVLKLNPKLSASQARDALNEFKGLSPEQFLKVNSDVINLSNAGKEKIPNVLLNAQGVKGKNLDGLSAEEISSMLMRHLI